MLAIWSMIIFSQYVAGCLAHQNGYMVATVGFSGLFNELVFTDSIFFNKAVSLGAVAANTAFSNTTDFSIYLQETNKLKNLNQNECVYQNVKTDQRVAVKTIMILSSDITSANEANYRKYAYLMMYPDNQATYMKEVETFYSEYPNCFYHDAYEVGFSNYLQE